MINYNNTSYKSIIQSLIIVENHVPNLNH